MQTQARNRMNQQPTVPGLKVAYGNAAVYYQPIAGPMFHELQAAAQSKGWFARMKDAILDLVTEEVDPDRPIGLSQLTRKTFQPCDEVGGQTIFQGNRGFQDYRFSQLIENRRY